MLFFILKKINQQIANSKKIAKNIKVSYLENFIKNLRIKKFWP